MQVGFNLSNQVQFSGKKTKVPYNNIKTSGTSDVVSFSSVKSKETFAGNLLDVIRIKMGVPQELKNAQNVQNDAEKIRLNVGKIQKESTKEFGKAQEAKFEAKLLFDDYKKKFMSGKAEGFNSFVDENTGNTISFESSDRQTIMSETKDGQLVKKTTIKTYNNSENVVIEVFADGDNIAKKCEYINDEISSVAINPKKLPDEKNHSTLEAYDELFLFRDGQTSSIYKNYKHTDSYSEYSYDKGFYYNNGELFSYVEGEEHSVFAITTKENYIIENGNISRYKKNNKSLLVKDGDSTELEYKYKNGKLVEATLGHEIKTGNGFTFTNIDKKYTFENEELTKLVKGYGAYNKNHICRQEEYTFENGKLKDYNTVE